VTALSRRDGPTSITSPAAATSACGTGADPRTTARCAKPTGDTKCEPAAHVVLVQKQLWGSDIVSETTCAHLIV